MEIDKDNQIKETNIKDLFSANMVIKGLSATINIKEGCIYLKNASKETVIKIDEISSANLVPPGMLGTGYLHIGTFSNPSPPNSKFSALSHPQCLPYKSNQIKEVESFFTTIQNFLKNSPPETRHPKGEAMAANAVKLDVLSPKTRKIYLEQINDLNVLFVILGNFDQAIVALTDRLIVVKAGLMAYAVGGGRTASFRYSDIVGFEINTGLGTAVIEIVTAGYTGTPSHDWLDAGKDRDPLILSNTLPLTKELLDKQRVQIEALRKLIDEAKSRPLQTENSTADIAKQIRDLSDLHEKGALSDEEFAQAKAKVLKSQSG